MKFSKIISVTLCISACLCVSCGNNTGSASKQLEGKWRVVQATGEIIGKGEGTEYIFENGKNLTTKLGPNETKGDIVKLTRSAIWVKYQHISSEVVFDYRLAGNRLILELRNSDGQAFTLERQ